MLNLKVLFKNHQAKTLLRLIILNILVTAFLLYVCHTSSSLALTAFTYLTIFDLLSLFTALVSIWVKFQSSSTAYPYGFKRWEVLATFSCSILTILGAFFVIKEGAESLFEEKEVHTSRLLPTALVGFTFHMFITLWVKNESFDYVVKSSSSSWLQEHIFDISENLCRYVPGLSKILLPRVNPFALIGFADLFAILGTYVLIQMGSSYLVDTYASILIAIMTIGTMLPFGVFTGKILLQTTPSHLITQLDKTLREASTLDGVLEFRDEHFWTLSFGVLVGSLHVRIRRDADEQLVLAHVWNKLAGLVQILTIHIFKDDWMRRTTHQLVYNQHNINMPYTTPLAAPLPAPTGIHANRSQVQLNPPTMLVPNMSQPVLNTNNANFSFNTNYNSLLNQSAGASRNNNFSNAQLELKNSSTAGTPIDNDYVIVNP